ncbi:hypothetical protein [Rhodohalobacter halophilus]|uniref:hypothetical protein n=1 Tax=Rhodohalobacter halophilus TaxID=1812810 RepID=UPI00083F9FFF|nr:hypothetical protein [Rhodohalobacter halophilus]
MAKLEPEEYLEFAAAAASAALTSSRKFIRNHRYYRNRGDSPEIIHRSELLELCSKLRMDLFGLINLLEDPAKHRSPFVVTIANEINDILEELHRKILFFEPNLIQGIIPLIDRQRSFWNSFTDVSFYNDALGSMIEHSISSDVVRIERYIHKLPEIAQL